MVMSLKALCLELDAMLISYFEAFDETIKLQNELNGLMRDGFLLMSKARVSMGVNSLSTLQYPDEMTAVFRTRDNAQDSDYVLDVRFEIQTDGIYAEEGLRQRKGDGDSSAVQDVAPKTKDPIRWFGVLVPQPLRDCQLRFKRATEVSLDLATKKAEMESLRKKYLQLHVVKDDIINSE